MPAYTKGSHAFGFCDKTGFRYPLDELVYEYRNGVKTGFRVGKDVADPDQPQNFLGRVKIFDPQALFDPRPDRFQEGFTFRYPALDEQTLQSFGSPSALLGGVGTVTITGDVPVVGIVAPVTGSATTSSVGDVTVSTVTTALTFDSTGTTLDSTNSTFDEA